MDAATDRSLRPADYLLLVLLCALMAAVSFVDGRWLTTHEATHCLNVREMVDSGNYALPTYGGRPWLERPPVPHWLTGIPAVIVADCSTTWAMRIGSVLAGMVAVLATAWAVAGCLGRTIGLFSGATLATMREFAAYAVGPEADIFIAAAVTLAGALFIRGEFGPNGNRPERATFFGGRPWTVLGVFVVLGATNAMKGPLFGTAFLTTAMAVYFLAGRHWAGLRRYVWFWGWLAYLAVGCLWPVFSYLAHPDVADIWAADYGRRWGKEYLREPPWYYAVQVPWNLFPWTIPAIAGLMATWRQVFRERDAAWQFLWAWALVPPVVFSFFGGKHHHYMLNCIAPWAPISAVGAMAMWRRVQEWPNWLRSPLFGLIVLGLPLTAAAFVFQKKIPGPEWVAYTVAIGWPVCVIVGWYFVTRPNGWTAAIGFVALILVIHTAAFMHRTAFLDRYEGDKAFLAKVIQVVPADAELLMMNEPDPLNAAWILYYGGPRVHLLHNESFLNSNRLPAEVYLIARAQDEKRLQKYGDVSVLLVSEFTRGEKSPTERYTLFRLRFYPDLVRSDPPPVNGMEATGRAKGPFLPGPTRREKK
jgi:4-amino-4-deoxy-L-arabinose transferase-like glycosyltransferase